MWYSCEEKLGERNSTSGGDRRALATGLTASSIIFLEASNICALRSAKLVVHNHSVRVQAQACAIECSVASGKRLAGRVKSGTYGMEMMVVPLEQLKYVLRF